MGETWSKVAAGHYRHDETGIEIRRVDVPPRSDSAVGTWWHVFKPARGGAHFDAYRARTLKRALYWAEQDDIRAARNAVAVAHAEAILMNAVRDRDAHVLCAGDDHDEADCPRRAAQLATRELARIIRRAQYDALRAAREAGAHPNALAAAASALGLREWQWRR